MRPDTTTRMTDVDHLTTSQLLTVAANLVSHAWNQRLIQLSVTHAGLVTLQELAIAGPQRQIDLATRLQVAGQTLGRMLHNLEERDLVSRTAGINGDTRQVLVTLTRRGNDTLAQAKKLETVLEATEAQLGDGLRSDLLHILQSHSRNHQKDRRSDIPGMSRAAHKHPHSSDSC
ncbi:MarR family winged helix-turn-helix transcriptional regulator [Arthrobacter sp. B1805]|uniref:MarR family winged helix-turn-helix transcriptional regulator n=1 Tax=Arthrobacter sp. B1805 TaxID=2058892 RepID=UPI0015E47726|nr:MarR family transcriptional regulator [Arthrobacter sp. B1805]